MKTSRNYLFLLKIRKISDIYQVHYIVLTSMYAGECVVGRGVIYEVQVSSSLAGWLAYNIKEYGKAAWCLGTEIWILPPYPLLVKS